MFKSFILSVLCVFCLSTTALAEKTKQLKCEGTLVVTNSADPELKLAVQSSFSLEMTEPEKITWRLGNAFEKKEITGVATPTGPAKPFLLSNDDENPYKGEVDLLSNLYPNDSNKFIYLALTQGPVNLGGYMKCLN